MCMSVLLLSRTGLSLKMAARLQMDDSNNQKLVLLKSVLVINIPTESCTVLKSTTLEQVDKMHDIQIYTTICIKM